MKCFGLLVAILLSATLGSLLIAGEPPRMKRGISTGRPVHTYSIVARDPNTGELGVAVQSHLIIVSGKPTGRPRQDRVFDLRVDDHADPVAELGRLVKLQRAFNLMNDGDLAVEKKDHAGALKAYAAAEALAPESAEMIFWHAVALVNMKRVDESLPLFHKVFAIDPNWKTLTPRLVGVELLPDDKAALEQILKQ